MPQSSSAEIATGKAAVGVASDIFCGCVIRTNGRSSASSDHVARKRLLRGLAGLVDHPAFELPVAGDRELADDLLAAGLGGFIGGRRRACPAPPERLQGCSPPRSGRLLRRKTCTLVPGKPLTPSWGIGPS